MSQNVIQDFPPCFQPDLWNINPDIFFNNQSATTGDISETQDQMIELRSVSKQSGQDRLMPQELTEKNIQDTQPKSDSSFPLKIETLSNIVDDQNQQEDRQGKQKKQQSSKHNFPKFFAGDIFSILSREIENQQQKNQSNQLIYFYKKYVLSILEKKQNRSIKCLRRLFIEEVEDAPLLKTFKTYAKRMKAQIKCQFINIAPLKRQLRSFFIQKKEEMEIKAQNRKIEDQHRCKNYREYIDKKINDLKKGKMSERERQRRSIGQGRQQR